MDYGIAVVNEHDKITSLFLTTFTASEGEEEGSIVSQLAHDLLLTTAPDDLYCFVAWDGDELAAAIIFTRLWFANAAPTTFILAPVAVDPRYQRQGIGQRLITFGLNTIQADGVEIAITYGDPAYYCKVGFSQVQDKDVPAPFQLSLPHGWQAQSLTSAALPPLAGPSRCVDALNKPEYW